jgi:hypothetical protein
MERVRDKPRVRLSQCLQRHVSDLAKKQGVTNNAMLEMLLHLGIASHLLVEMSVNTKEISTSAND